MYEDFQLVDMISTHALLAEGDWKRGYDPKRQYCHFNPRPPCGGRQYVDIIHPKPQDFNPRPPCGGRLVWKFLVAVDICISTHALLAEGDAARCIARRRRRNFNPRPPCGGRPRTKSTLARFLYISTHALLAEGDAYCDRHSGNRNEFQPTPSLRRATPAPKQHIPRSRYFNPRPPCGGRHNIYMVNYTIKCNTLGG